MNKITLEGAEALEFLQYKKANLEKLVKETEANIKSLTDLSIVKEKKTNVLKTNVPKSNVNIVLPNIKEIGLLKYNPHVKGFRKHMFGNVKTSVLNEIKNSNIPLSRIDVTSRIINNNKFVNRKHRQKLKASISVAISDIIKQNLVESINENNTEYFCIK